MEETDPKTIIQRTVILNDKTEYDGVAYSNAEKDTVFVSLDGKYSMTELFPVFMDPDKTAAIRATIYNHNSHSMMSDETFTGYTRMAGIRTEGTAVSITLKKPVSVDE